jgi:hypothetical protein
VEVGLKFRSDKGGLITDVRFYKGGAANAGPHVGHLWTSTGTLLGSVTFTDESDIGWQQAFFQTPVTITANTTYVVSYFAPAGNYAADVGFFTSLGVDNAPLHALSDPDAGGNGVFNDSPSGGFPSQSFNATNYWVDVVFADTAFLPPQVLSTTPARGATNVPTGVTPTASFSEPLDPASVNFTTVQMTDAADNLVLCNVSYSASNFTLTLTPVQPLQPGQEYTVTLKGTSPAPHITDEAGTPLTTTYTWSFTTEPPPSPLIGSGNKFTRHYQGILRAGGFNNFNARDLTQVTGEILAQYDVAIPGEMARASTQVTMLSNWITAGGNLIAMRPDKQPSSRLGLSVTAVFRAANGNVLATYAP